MTIFFSVAGIDDTRSVRKQFTSVLRLTSVSSKIYDSIVGYAFRTVYHIYNNRPVSSIHIKVTKLATIAKKAFKCPHTPHWSHLRSI